jgi:nucleoside-triphosphatase THEP1
VGEQRRAAILTAERGVGKTTLCLELARAHPGFRGIVSPAILDSEGRKVGFSCLCLETGDRWELGRADIRLEGPLYGKYSFSADGLARAVACAQWAIVQPGGVTVIDEIGPLELERGAGFAPLLDMLASAGDLLLVTRPRFASLLSRLLQGHMCEQFLLSREMRLSLGTRVAEFLGSAP